MTAEHIEPRPSLLANIKKNGISATFKNFISPLSRKNAIYADTVVNP
jgi:hypothetical protein